jgi:hypothetical protein
MQKIMLARCGVCLVYSGTAVVVASLVAFARYGERQSGDAAAVLGAGMIFCGLGMMVTAACV